MKQKLILAVDDDPKMRELLQVVLESAGFAVRAAAGGEAALRMIQESPPDLLITDIVLPNFDGLELVRRARRLPGLSDIPVLLISGILRSSLLGKEAMTLGKAEVMSKPLDIEELVKRASKLMNVEAEADVRTRAARRLERLRRAYLRTLPERIDRLQSDWFEYLNAGGVSALERVHRTVHAMAGTGGTLGLQRLGELAAEAEVIVGRLLARRQDVDPEVRRKMAVFLSTLVQAFGQIPSWAGIESAVAPEGEDGGGTGDGTAVLLIEDEESLARHLVFGMRSFGYHVTWAKTQEEAMQVLEARRFSATILDLILRDDANAGFAFLKQLRKGLDDRTGVVMVVSQRDDLEARLTALRMGAGSYLHKPVTIETIVEHLDRELGLVHEDEPFRVLVVDDDEIAMRQSVDILGAAGMTAVGVNEPARAVDEARRLSPDLMLVDLHLTECSGLELARVLRQDEALIFVPVVLVAPEEDEILRLEAVSAGVVDVLVKPVAPELLVAHSRARAQRGRILRRLGSHDSLTGLLNHGSVLTQLRSEVARCEREGGELAIAMVDLDGFKQLNDRLGHMVGDRVLKTVARVLKQRLRRTDFVGRYGGDEFLLVMAGTDAAGAASVLAEVRRDLAPLLEEYGEPDSRVTVSIGVADFPAHEDVAGLLEAADRALYRAKAEGKDRLAIAE